MVQLSWSQPPALSPLVRRSSQLQGKSLRVTELAGLRDEALLVPGLTGMSAASLFILFLMQLHQISMFTLAGCWRRLPRRWVAGGASGCAGLVTLLQRCQVCLGWIFSPQPLNSLPGREGGSLVSSCRCGDGVKAAGRCTPPSQARWGVPSKHRLC